MTLDQLTYNDYLYFEALADSELLDVGEVNDFIKICEKFVQHGDAQRFISQIMIAAPIELRDAREIADAIKANVIGGGQTKLGNVAAPATVAPTTSQVRIPAQQARPPMQSRPQISQAPAASAPRPAAPQPQRELPKMPVGFTAFGPLTATEQEGRPNAAPQISVYSQKTISAPSAAVFPSSQNKINQSNQPASSAPQKPAAPKIYEKGKDPYRESLQ